MTKKERLEEARVLLLRYRENLALVPSTHLYLNQMNEAQFDLMNAALEYISDVDDDENAVYSDGSKMSGERLLTVAPWGRAAVKMADAILAGRQ